MGYLRRRKKLYVWVLLATVAIGVFLCWLLFKELALYWGWDVGPRISYGRRRTNSIFVMYSLVSGGFAGLWATDRWARGRAESASVLVFLAPLGTALLAMVTCRGIELGWGYPPEGFVMQAGLLGFWIFYYFVYQWLLRRARPVVR